MYRRGTLNRCPSVFSIEQAYIDKATDPIEIDHTRWNTKSLRHMRRLSGCSIASGSNKYI